MYKSEGELKVLQYFVNVRHNLAVLDVFTEVMKETNHSGLWDAELAWYSPSATHLIYIHSLESTLLSLTDLSWSSKFKQNFFNRQVLQYRVINDSFTFHKTNVYD